jgi:hypothetical protein
MNGPLPKPKCSLCRCEEASLWCSTHKQAVCTACVKRHATVVCVWGACPPLRLMPSTQLSLKFEETLRL